MDKKTIHAGFARFKQLNAGNGIKAILLLLTVLTIMITGCSQPASEEIAEEPQSVDVVSGDMIEPDSDADEDELEDDVPLLEYTDEEKAQLSIDMEKIGAFRIGWHLNEEGTDWEETDDLGALKTLYPDFELVHVEYKDIQISTLPKEGQKREYWHSESTGFEYYIEHFYYREKIPSTRMRHMYGPADALMSGLTRPIETRELMEALGIPKSEMPIDEAFDSLRFSTGGYSITGFYYRNNDSDNSVVIILPEPGYINSVISIEISPSKPEIINPADRLLVRLDNLSPE